MTGKFVFQLMFLVGVTLWIPGWALLNVGDAWGLQPVLALALILTVLTVLVKVGARAGEGGAGMRSERLLFSGVYLVMLILCTVFSTAGVTKSGMTFGVEALGLTFSATLAWWLCRSERCAAAFFDGFRWGGLVSSGFAIYQVVGWRLNLPLTYIPMNNSSFILISPEMGQYLKRAFAVTPEPSVLASLLLPLLAMMTVDVIAYGGSRRYLGWAVAGLGYLSTSSQSTAFAPFYVLGVVAFLRVIMGPLRPMRRSDLYGIGALMLGVITLLALNESILQSLGRLSGQDNISAIQRFGDVLIGLEMFREHPLLGAGLGASGVQLEAVIGKLGMDTTSSGISNGLLRVLAEQGLVGVAMLLTGAACILPSRTARGVPAEQAVPLAYQAAFVAGTALSGALFVGYRNLYSLWLIVPLGLSLKWRLSRLRAAQPQTVDVPQYVSVGGMHV